MAAKLNLPAPPPFKVLGENTNIARSWELYIKRFEYYLTASGITKDDQKKAMLIHLAGEEVQDIYENLNDVGESYKNTVEALTNYFKPQKNSAYERHLFRKMKQEDTETIDNFIIRLKKMSVSCEFPDNSANDMIRDQVIEKCKSKDLRKRLLREKELTLDKIQTIARAAELSEMHGSKMEAKEVYPSVETVNKIENRRRPKQYHPRTAPRSAFKSSQGVKTCYRCGNKGHAGHECRKSRNITCRICKKVGHFARMCKTKSATSGTNHVRSMDFKDEEEFSSDDEHVLLN